MTTTLNDRRNAATGVYFATLDVGGTVVKTRLALLR